MADVKTVLANELNDELIKKLAKTEGKLVGCLVNKNIHNNPVELDTFYLYKFEDFTLIELSNIITFLKNKLLIRRFPKTSELSFTINRKNMTAFQAVAEVETYIKGQNSNLYELLGDVLYVTMSEDTNVAFLNMVDQAQQNDQDDQ